MFAIANRRKFAQSGHPDINEHLRSMGLFSFGGFVEDSGFDLCN
jgi:hypothetical protein